MSTVDDAFQFCHTFEGELLIELMLRYWQHPLADDTDYRNGLIESALEAIRMSMDGKRLLEDVPPSQMNFVAAVWYAEWAALQIAITEIQEREFQQREEWLRVLRRALPSCFCDQTNLPD